jgi:hypothetical protein
MNPKVGRIYFVSSSDYTFYMRTKTGERLNSNDKLMLDSKEPLFILEKQNIILPSGQKILLCKILTKEGIFYININYVYFFEV